MLLAATDEGVGQGDLPQPDPDVGARALDEDASGVGMGHALEVIDKALGAGTLLATAGDGWLDLFRYGVF
ncbi:hypothetical protein D3C72_2233810 [compost metagenome]